MLITPVVDRNHESWSLPQSIKNAILEYKAAAWQDYWLRAWCRVEAFLGSVSPLVEDHGASSRSSHFQAGLHAGECPRVPPFIANASPSGGHAPLADGVCILRTSRLSNRG